MSRTVTSNAIAVVLILAPPPASVDGADGRKVQRRGGRRANVPPNQSVGRQGRLYAADTTNFRVQVFDRAGTPPKSIGAGDGPARTEAYRSLNT
jgi:hypothetical protein